jgi:hypothetical protein
MAGLSACTALQELYLSHNGLTAVEVGWRSLPGLFVSQPLLSMNAQQYLMLCMPVSI